jgi:hypothetical protein
VRFRSFGKRSRDKRSKIEVVQRMDPTSRLVRAGAGQYGILAKQLSTASMRPLRPARTTLAAAATTSWLSRLQSA